MALTAGRYRFGSDTGSLTVHTAREGIGAAAGHDLVLQVMRWVGSAEVDFDDPSRSRVDATVDTRSFQVRAGMGGIRPLTDHDRGEITTIVASKVLAVSRFPTIGFASRSVLITADQATLVGDLTVRGLTRGVEVEVSNPEHCRVTGSAALRQTHWAITPYRGLFGALKVADAVIVRFDVTLVPA